MALYVLLLVFPQDRVDSLCLASRSRARANHDLLGFCLPTKAFYGYPCIETSPQKLSEDHLNKFLQIGFQDDSPQFPAGDKAPLFIGLGGPETLLIDTDYVQSGFIWVLDQGVLIVDGALLDLSGHLICTGGGRVYLMNGATLHFNQFYVAQYYLWLTDSSRFEAYDSEVDANGTMHFVYLDKNSTYIAERTSFPDWTFRQVYDRATLILRDIYH
ncbi:MAG: hypothetical protein ACPL68_05485, partial [Candidatus Hydrothermia bacterium]